MPPEWSLISPGANVGTLPDVIVLMGPAGSGKTTVGRALADTCARVFVDADDYHPEENVRKMRAGVALTDEDRTPWLARLQELIHGPSHTHGLTEGGLVLACSALRQPYRATLSLGPKSVAFFLLQVPVEELSRRLAARDGHFFPQALLDSQLQVLEPPSVESCLDGTLPVEALCKILLERLKTEKAPF